MSDPHPARRYRAIFFELFGTLASGSTDDEAHLKLMESVAQRFGIATEPTMLLGLFNDRLRQSPGGDGTGWTHHQAQAQGAFRSIVGDFGIKPGPEGLAWFGDEYLRVHQSFVRLIPGGREMLGELYSAKLHLGLIEDCDTRYLDRMLCWLDIVPFIDSRTTPEEPGAAGPDGGIYHLALGKARCDARQAVFVGGSVDRHLRGARAAGMTTVLLDAPMSERDLGAVDFVASSPARLARILYELAYTA
jgi:FMN phosphatase YigB (HAD superfamily)